MNEILKLDNVEKYYGNKANLTKAVDKISFSVEKGEFVGIMGASGSGKYFHDRPCDGRTYLCRRERYHDDPGE